MAVQFPAGTSDYWESKIPQPGIDAAQKFTIGAWMKPKGDGGEGTDAHSFMGWGRHSDASRSYKGAIGFYWFNETGKRRVGRYSHDLADDSHAVYFYASPDESILDVWHLYLFGRGEDGKTQQRIIKMNSSNVHQYTSTTNDFENEAILNASGDGSNGWILGGSPVSGRGPGDCALCHVFRVDEWIPDSDVKLLAAGSTIEDLGYSPVNWYKLLNRFDTKDYGSQGNDINALIGTCYSAQSPPVLNEVVIDPVQRTVVVPALDTDLDGTPPGVFFPEGDRIQHTAWTLVANSNYYWRVRALDPNGKDQPGPVGIDPQYEEYWGDWSDIRKLLVKNPTPDVNIKLSPAALDLNAKFPSIATGAKADLNQKNLALTAEKLWPKGGMEGKLGSIALALTPMSLHWETSAPQPKLNPVHLTLTPQGLSQSHGAEAELGPRSLALQGRPLEPKNSSGAKIVPGVLSLHSESMPFTSTVNANIQSSGLQLDGQTILPALGHKSNVKVARLDLNSHKLLAARGSWADIRQAKFHWGMQNLPPIIGSKNKFKPAGLNLSPHYLTKIAGKIVVQDKFFVHVANTRLLVYVED